jgi:hypothetical protein
MVYRGTIKSGGVVALPFGVTLPEGTEGLVADLAQDADQLPQPVERPEEPRGYPVADFLSPTEYAWDEDAYAAAEAVRAYLSDCHADH